MKAYLQIKSKDPIPQATTLDYIKLAIPKDTVGKTDIKFDWENQGWLVRKDTHAYVATYKLKPVWFYINDHAAEYDNDYFDFLSALLPKATKITLALASRDTDFEYDYPNKLKDLEVEFGISLGLNAKSTTFTSPNVVIENNDCE